MFKRLARFRLFQSWGTAPGLHGAMPANDNQPNVLRPRGSRRIRSHALVCHWSLIDDGTRLGCRWQPEVPARQRLGTGGQTTRLPIASGASDLLGRHRPLQHSTLTGERDAGHRNARRWGAIGVFRSFSAGEQNPALRDDLSSVAQDFT